MPKITRRTALILMGAGGGLVLAGRASREEIDATTQMEAQRDVDVPVAADADAYLGIEGEGTDLLTITNQADDDATIYVATTKSEGLVLVDSADEQFDLAVNESRDVEFELWGILSTLNKFPIFYNKHVHDDAELLGEFGDEPHLSIDAVRDIKTRKHTELQLFDSYTPPSQNEVDFEMQEVGT